MSNMNVEVRNSAFDSLKFFAIFLVVWGHSIQYLNSVNCVEEPMYRIIYSFHMPLFMMISGYFATGSMKMDFFSMILKKGRQILLPCFAWITLVWLCLNIIEVIKGNQILFIKLYWGYLNQFWFLKSLFICYLLAFIGRKGGMLGMSVAVLISQCISYSSVNFMFPAFVIGLFLRETNFLYGQYIRYRYIVYLLFVMMLVFYDETFWSNELLAAQTIYSGDLQYAFMYIYKIIIGVLGALSFLMLFVVDLKNVRLMSHVSNYGQLTLGIYILQSLILERFIGRIVCFDMASFPFIYIVSPLMSVLVVCACVVIIRIIQRFKLAKLVFLGESMNS